MARGQRKKVEITDAVEEPIAESVGPEATEQEQAPVTVEPEKKRYHLKKNGVGIFRDAEEAKRLVNKEGWAYA